MKKSELKQLIKEILKEDNYMLGLGMSGEQLGKMKDTSHNKYDKLFMNWWNNNYENGETFKWNKQKRLLFVKDKRGHFMYQIPYSDLVRDIKGLPSNPKLVFEDGSIGLTLPDGTINGDPKGDEDAEPTLPVYKKKEKNISEAVTHIDYSGIKFMVIITLRERGGEVIYMPKTSKDIDALEKYGKDRAKKFLHLKTKQSLGFPVWDDSYSDESAMRFKFQLTHVEDLLIKKIK